MSRQITKTRLNSLDPSHINLGLDRMLQVMERLGNPHLGFKSVHIAGTNGKGSVAAFLSTILTFAGYRAGLYTSPHLERFSERVRISGEEIFPDALTTLSHEVDETGEKLPAGELTYFEHATAVAFLHFARKKVDIAVIETGLGGRLDATNIITPLVSVITSVALDHAEYLGTDIKIVAAEKGGIIKEGVPLAIGLQEGAVAPLLEEMAEKKGAKVLRYGRDFEAEDAGEGTFHYRGPSGVLKDMHVSLHGRHQKENAAVALTTAGLLADQGFEVYENALRKGVEDTLWPGRFEIVSKEPDVILDGAHNPAGMKRIAETVIERYGERKGIVVAGFLAEKDVEGMLRLLAPLVDSLILTKPEEGRAFDPEGEMRYKRVLPKGVQCRVIADAEAALEEGRALLHDGGAPFMLVAGSLYLIGTAKTFFKERL